MTTQPEDHYETLESAAVELMTAFEIHAPPVPIETMLQNPRDEMWETVDVNQLSGTFLSIKDRFSPRMSLARLLARHVVSSPWGQARNLLAICQEDEDYLRAFARMLIMPRNMIETMTGSSRNSAIIPLEFEVPEDDARQRLSELFV